jgi:tetratricopeptide (TPR) repeat protein
MGAEAMTDSGDDGLFPEYIPRDEESAILAAVARVLETRRTEAVLLYGPGGVGKTRLVRALAQREAAGPATWLEPIDLDDPEYWLLPNLQANVATQLDPAGEYFARYTEYLAQPPKESRERVTREALVSHLGHVQRIFLECYTDYARGTDRPIVIVFDTVEAIRSMGLLVTLAREWMAELPQTLFILSGRPVPNGTSASDPIREHLTDPQHPMPVTTVPLGSFPWSTAERYLASSGVAEGLTDRQRSTLIHLTQGHPLWLAHTVSFLSERGMPEEAKADLSVIERDVPFDGPMTVRGRQLHEEFKRRVLSVYRDAEFWHEVVLRLAVVRQSVNEQIWRQLMVDRAIPEGPLGAPTAWQQLLSKPWIRPRANGRYVTLHDVVAEELARTVIPAQDEDEQGRRDLWRRAAEIFGAEAEGEGRRIAADSQRLDSRRQLAGELVPAVPFARNANDIGEEKREVDQLKASRFLYLLLSDREAGCRYFLELFEQASRDQDLLFQDLLATVMLRCLGIGEATSVIDDAARSALERFRNWLRDQQHALYREIGITLAEFLLTSGQATTAVRLLRDLPLDGADVHQVSDQKILLANAYLRVPGEVREGLRYLREALFIADDAALEPAARYRLAARAYKELGFFYRNLGRLDEAETAYGHARDAIEFVLATAETTHDRLEKASIQSNWAYVKGLNGDHEDGLRLVESAIKVRTAFGSGLSVGISLSTKGEVLRYKQKFKKAVEAYDKAEEIFKAAQEQSWLGTIYQEKAICLYQAYLDGETSLVTGDQLDEAWELADRAVKLCRERSVRAYPSALNRAARIIGDRDADQGLELLEEGIAAARAMSDGWFWLANLVELAELSYRTWWRTGDNRYRDEIARYESHFDRVVSEYEFPDLRGRWEVVAGHLRVHDWAVTEDDSQLDIALRYYASGFMHIAECGHVGSSGALAIPGAFKTFARLFGELPGNDRSEWIGYLRHEWSGSQPGSTMLLALLEELY